MKSPGPAEILVWPICLFILLGSIFLVKVENQMSILEAHTSFQSNHSAGWQYPAGAERKTHVWKMKGPESDMEGKNQQLLQMLEQLNAQSTTPGENDAWRNSTLNSQSSAPMLQAANVTANVSQTPAAALPRGRNKGRIEGRILLGSQLNNQTHHHNQPRHLQGRSISPVVICVVAGNEMPHVREWADYHLSIGVAHIYVADGYTTDGSLAVWQSFSPTQVTLL
eukprot:CAMPEP_0181337066 /NCGR_PEP_ID=MMETSP1101-20121128/27795_1 /TAXON_ID=46948 /ORGANISM="Rhodomonas abbreviata, Strain Caron Lab Isolate" /LENGTH=223 /DNA_ID=CAMNT_0023447485 /DNA_START=187 /DNA_END=855 /DNA_ORIENTATION=-